MAAGLEDGLKKVLITGIAGAQGRLLAARLATVAEVCGVDVVPWRGPGLGLRVHRVDLRKRKFEDVVRTERPDAVVHMGFVRHFEASERMRHDVNVRGTTQLLDHCVKYGVQQLVVVSSSAVYGAFAENPYSVDEDFPLSASRSYPEIRDQVEVDTLASGYLWQHPEVRTSVLRPVNVLGPKMRSMMATYLRLPRVPTVAGYDPMMQIIGEDDMTEALVLALEKDLRGVYNVAGSGEVPLHTAISESGGVAWPIPMPFARMICQRFFDWGIWSYPPGVVDYLRFPVSVSGRRFAEATGFVPRVSLREVFASMRNAR
jgi:UDP-glucose 4-epimerase